MDLGKRSEHGQRHGQRRNIRASKPHGVRWSGSGEQGGHIHERIQKIPVDIDDSVMAPSIGNDIPSSKEARGIPFATRMRSRTETNAHRHGDAPSPRPQPQPTPYFTAAGFDCHPCACTCANMGCVKTSERQRESGRHQEPAETAIRKLTPNSRTVLGYLDSNQEWMNQNHLCCQLHHTPMADPTAMRPPSRSYPQPDLNRCWRRERA